MLNKKRVFFLGIILLSGLMLSGPLLAQEDTVILEENQENDQIIDQVIALDEDIEAEDLGVGKPMILPDNPFYFLKTWTRNIRQAFAFRNVVKAELMEKFANEKLVELKEMVKREKSVEVIKRAADNYEGEIEKIKDVTAKIKEKAQESPEVEKFLDKFVKHQILHQRVLQKLEDQVPAENMEKITEMREKHLETFAEVMTKLEDRSEKLKETLEAKMEEIEGSKYKNFKNLEILSELEEIVPEQVRETIRNVQENTLMKFKTDLEEMPVQDQERFGDYLEKISGGEENQVRVLESLRMKLKETPKIEQNIIQSRDKALEQVQQRTQEEVRQETQTRAEVQEQTQERVQERKQVCVNLWDPVCGSDGRTYSNECFAEIAGVSIKHRGACQQDDTTEAIDLEQIKERARQSTDTE